MRSSNKTNSENSKNERTRRAPSCYFAHMRDTTIRYCPNPDCPVHGHVTYTQGTRCQFCRWDLKPARSRSETVPEQKGTGFNRPTMPARSALRPA
jgi:hypothetical protein